MRLSAVLFVALAFRLVAGRRRSGEDDTLEDGRYGTAKGEHAVGQHQHHPRPLLFSSFMGLRPSHESSIMQNNEGDEPAIDGTTFMKTNTGEEQDALDAWLGPAPRGPAYGEVPQKVHMVHVSDTSLDWHLFHYLHVNAAIKEHRPETLYIYYHAEPQGDYWQRTLVLPEVRRVQMDGTLYHTFFGHQVHVGAHHADKVRLMALLRHGGVYLDTDVLSLRDLAPLRKASFLQGACAFMGEEPGGLGNSLIGSAPNCPFLRLWWQNYTDFDDNNWGEHSIVRPGKLRQDYPSLLKVLPMSAFTPYYPTIPNAPGLFQQDMEEKISMPGVDRLLASKQNQKPLSSLGLNLDMPFTIHLFSQYNGKALAEVTEQGRCQEDSAYNKLTRLSWPC